MLQCFIEALLAEITTNGRAKRARHRPPRRAAPRRVKQA